MVNRKTLLTNKEVSFASTLTNQIIKTFLLKPGDNLQENLLLIQKKLAVIANLPYANKFQLFRQMLEKIFQVLKKEYDLNNSLLIDKEVFTFLGNNFFNPAVHLICSHPCGFLRVAVDPKAVVHEKPYLEATFHAYSILKLLKDKLQTVSQGKKSVFYGGEIINLLTLVTGRRLVALLVSGSNAEASTVISNYKNLLQEFKIKFNQHQFREVEHNYWQVYYLGKCILSFRENNFFLGKKYFKCAANLHFNNPRISGNFPSLMLALIPPDFFELSLDIIENLSAKNKVQDTLFYIQQMSNIIKFNRKLIASISEFTEFELKIIDQFEEIAKKTNDTIPNLKKKVFDEKFAGLNKEKSYLIPLDFSVPDLANKSQKELYNVEVKLSQIEHVPLLLQTFNTQGLVCEMVENNIVIKKFLNTLNSKIHFALICFSKNIEDRQLQLMQELKKSQEVNQVSVTDSPAPRASSQAEINNCLNEDCIKQQKIKTRKQPVGVPSVENTKLVKTIVWGKGLPIFNPTEMDSNVYKLNIKLGSQRFFITPNQRLLDYLQRENPKAKIGLEQMCDRGLVRFTSSIKKSIGYFKGIILFSDKLGENVKASKEMLVAKIKNPTKDERFLGCLKARKIEDGKIYNLIEIDALTRHQGTITKFK